MSAHDLARDTVIADVVIDAAAKTKPWTAGSAKRFVADVYDTVVSLGRDDGIALEEFKDTLFRLHREGLVTLARADLVAAMPPDKVERSEIRHGIADFHFVVTAHKNASTSAAAHIREMKRRHADRVAEMRAALKASPAVILTRGEFQELVIVTGETHPGESRLRATTFLVDGPWGHENYKTMDEIAVELARRSWDHVRAIDDDEVMEWTSTPEFREGAKRVAYIQAANALRYWAGQKGYQSEAYRRIEEILRQTDRMVDDIEGATAIVEKELAAVSPRLVDNPAWVTKVLADAYEEIEHQVPPAWLPKLTDVGSRHGMVTAHMREYGCGAYGCVLPTLDPKIVLKITTDDTEAEFADKLVHTLPVAVTVAYHTVIKLPTTRNKRDVYLLWRESADAVGDLEKELGKTASDLVAIQHDDAQVVLRLIIAKADGPAIMEAVSMWLGSCTEMAEQDDVPELQFLGRGMLRCFRELRVFFGDVHAGNLGRVTRNGESRWVITDPGNVVVFRRS